MFCARCGEQIPDASVVCQICGREATLKMEPPPPLPKPAPAVYGQMNWPPEQETMYLPARRPELKGVGGWLLFFCISLTILSPLITLGNLADRGFETRSLFDLALVAVSVVTGVLLWSVNERVFAFLWIYFALLFSRLVLRILELYIAGHAQPELIARVIPSLIPIILWFLYFKQSDRVQATFGRNL